ncbi:MAG: glucose-6-phosphate-specific signal transduction histidine kinase, partial [Enterobacterales bacterium]
MVSWYFPVGLNLVSFILLPLRYWPAVFLGQAIGQIAFSHLYYDFALTELWSTLYKDWIDKILLLLPLIYIKYQRIPLEIDRFKGLMLILGGFVGILFALMIMYSGIWLWKNYNNIELTKLLHFIVSLLVLILSTSSIYLFQPEVIDLLRMVGVLTFIWFAYQFGWIGVIVAALSLNSLILIIAYGVSDTAMMLENQTTLTTYGLTALLLGA